MRLRSHVLPLFSNTLSCSQLAPIAKVVRVLLRKNPVDQLMELGAEEA